MTPLITWTPDQVRCLRMCGYTKPLPLFAESNGVSRHSWTEWELGRARPHLVNVEKLDALAKKIGWNPERCRTFCARKFK